MVKKKLFAVFFFCIFFENHSKNFQLINRMHIVVQFLQSFVFQISLTQKDQIDLLVFKLRLISIPGVFQKILAGKICPQIYIFISRSSKIFFIINNIFQSQTAAKFHQKTWQAKENKIQNKNKGNFIYALSNLNKKIKIIFLCVKKILS